MTEIERLQMNANQANSDFVAIKGKIVEKGVEIAEGTRTAEYASKVDEVYEKGKQAQYDEFWDGVFSGVSWQGKFYGSSWNNRTFYPDRDIRPINSANNLFNLSMISDLAGRLRECGVSLDTSGITLRSDSMFNYAIAITTVPYLDLRNATWGNILASMFTECSKLITIEGIHLAEDGSQKLDDSSSAFRNCVSLENVTFYGTIGNTGLNFQWSTKLSKASWISIINALSPTATGKSITGSLESVQRAFETSTGAMDGDSSAEWLNLIASKSNWTINLV